MPVSNAMFGGFSLSAHNEELAAPGLAGGEDGPCPAAPLMATERRARRTGQNSITASIVSPPPGSMAVAALQMKSFAIAMA